MAVPTTHHFPIIPEQFPSDHSHIRHPGHKFLNSINFLSIGIYQPVVDFC